MGIEPLDMITIEFNNYRVNPVSKTEGSNPHSKEYDPQRNSQRQNPQERQLYVKKEDGLMMHGWPTDSYTPLPQWNSEKGNLLDETV